MGRRLARGRENVKRETWCMVRDACRSTGDNRVAVELAIRRTAVGRGKIQLVEIFFSGSIGFGEARMVNGCQASAESQELLVAGVCVFRLAGQNWPGCSRRS